MADLHRLKLLAVFAFVVEAGSFAAAARHLHSSRARISENISQLESELGVRLLHRSTRQLTLTEEGRAVYDSARDLSGILEHVDYITSQSTPRGRVSLTTTYDIALNVLMPVLEGFQKKYPDVMLDLRLNDEKVDMIAAGIDVAIRVGIPRENGLIARPLGQSRFALYASAAYLDRYGMPQNVADLCQHRWVVLSLPTVHNGQPVFWQNEGKPILPTHYSVSSSPLVMQQMILAGFGIGGIFPMLMQKEIQQGLLRPVMPQLLGHASDFSLVYPSRKHMPLRTRCLIDYLLQAQFFNFQVF
jgi:DNA-binding transcriptional LysR family regulator